VCVCVRVCVCVCVCINIYIYIYIYIRPSVGEAHAPWRGALAFTRYCDAQYGMVYGIQIRGRGGGRILRNSIAIVLQPCGQCRWEGAIKERSIRAQQPRSKTLPCKGQGGLVARTALVGPPDLYTTSLLLIVYGVWHTKERSGGGHIWRKRHAIVSQ